MAHEEQSGENVSCNPQQFGSPRVLAVQRGSSSGRKSDRSRSLTPGGRHRRRSTPRKKTSRSNTPPGGKGNHLRTVLCQLELEAQIGELTDQDRTQDLPMEDSFAVTSREESVPVVIHASIRIAKPHATPARSSKGDQCLQSQRSQAFASTMHMVDAPGINALTSMRNLRLLLKCRLPLSRAALRGGLTVLLHCLRIFERGVPRPSGSLGNDLWL